MISVVIPAYNEEKAIGKCLQSLCRQKTSRAFEVILVDNASTDDTKKIAKEYEKKINLHIIEQPIKGRGIARFTGVKEAKGNIILSTDADTLLPSYWVENMGKHFDDQKTVAITGTAKIIDNNWLTNMGFNIGILVVMFIYRIIVRHFWFAGFNFGIRKGIYDKVGGFDKELSAAEDVDLSFRVSKFGKILFKNDVTVTVSGRRFGNNLLKGFLAYSRAYASYILKNKKTVQLSDVR